MAKAKGNRRLSVRERSKKDGGESAAKKGARTGMSRDIGAVVLLALGVGLGLSLGTFSALDGALMARGLPPTNLVGLVGHNVGAAVYGFLGFSALVLPAAVIVVAWRLFRGVTGRVTAIGAAASVVLTLCAATLAQVVLNRFDLASFPAGGAVGAALALRSVRVLSTAGSVLLTAAVAVVAAIVAVDLDVRRWASHLGDGAAALFGFARARVSDAIDEHREAVAELRAEEAADRALRAEQAAATLAAQADVDADGEESAGEARAAAGALALEQVRRAGLEDPAWVDALEPDAVAAGSAASAFDERGEPAEPGVVTGRALGETEPLVEPSEAGARRRRKKSDAGEPALPPVESAPEPVAAPIASLLPPPPARPEIVVSSAMLEERKAKKKSEKKEAPAFAFTKAGDVFRLPPIDLLDVHEEKAAEVDKNGLTNTAGVIVATLREHGIDGQITTIRPGPVVTLYEFLPVAGVKLARIENCDKELTMALAATRLRIIAPIPGKGVVGIEVPNRHRSTVFLRDILESDTFAHAGGFLPLGLGKDIEGVPACVDLQKMPHLLIAGTTGSGKSVGLNTMILSMLYRQTPAEVRMIMVDPKMTELSPYEDIPHLLLPVVTDPQKASRALQWAVDEMERRTQILADTGSKDLKSYNSKVEKHRAEGTLFGEEDLPKPKKLLVVDEVAGETEEQAAARLAAESAPAPGGDGWVALPGAEAAAEPAAAAPAEAGSKSWMTPAQAFAPPAKLFGSPEFQDLDRAAPRRSGGGPRRAEAAAEAPLHRGHHRRARRPHAHRAPRGGDLAGPPGGQGPRHRHPPHRGDPAPLHRRGHRHHQEQLPGAHLLPPREPPRLGDHHQRPGRREPARQRRHAHHDRHRGADPRAGRLRLRGGAPPGGRLPQGAGQAGLRRVDPEGPGRGRRLRPLRGRRGPGLRPGHRDRRPHGRGLGLQAPARDAARLQQGRQDHRADGARGARRPSQRRQAAPGPHARRDPRRGERPAEPVRRGRPAGRRA